MGRRPGHQPGGDVEDGRPGRLAAGPDRPCHAGMRRRRRALCAPWPPCPAWFARQQAERDALQGRVHRPCARNEIRVPRRRRHFVQPLALLLTASADLAPFRFIYLGDAQNGLDRKWPRVVRAAFAAAPDARFVVHAGDLVGDGYDDRQWGAWLAGMGAKASEVPAVPVPGNHDVIRSTLSRVFAAPELWNAHFALPANGPAELPELAGTELLPRLPGSPRGRARRECVRQRRFPGVAAREGPEGGG